MAWNWAWRKNRQESKSAPPLVALTDPGGPNWGGRDGGALTRDGYLHNAVAYRCVRMVAEAAASVPLVTAHEGAARLIRRPMPEVPGAAFLEGVYAQLQLAGNAFLEAVRLPDESGIAALFPLQPASVRPVTDGRGWAESWAVRERRGERLIRREETGWSPVLHLKLFHPQDDILGLPALAPARRALDLHNASADWAKSLIDGPRLADEASGVRVAAWADPWPGEVRVLAGLDAGAMRERAVLSQPAVTGRLLEVVAAGPVGRWDRANTLRIETTGGFASLPESQVLSGGNRLLVETSEGWELLQFETAELIGPEEWRLSGLLRGQQGSPGGAVEAGARVLLLDGSDVFATPSPGEFGADLLWRAAGTDETESLAFEDEAGRPWPVCHLRVEDGMLGWTRRGADLPESWALPEGENTGRFAVAFDSGSGFGKAEMVELPSAAIPGGAIAARVAEIGADGRTGRWVSIGLATP